MGGRLFGWMPLGRPVMLHDGPLTLDAGGLEQWAADLDAVPVLLAHDATRPVGWVTRAKVTTRGVLVLGEFDARFDPRSTAAGRVIRAHVMEGLSPFVNVRQGQRRFADGRWGRGTVVHIPELSIVGNPRIPRAHWEAPTR